ncbi:MAG: hypothetical protein KDD53_06775 [Bdellovibrionales bacterium]|nr:hypothetical protein [Bdellovibrionales bacterium]
MVASFTIGSILFGMTDDTNKRILERIKIKYSEPRELPNGELSRTFFDCIQLTPNELSRIASQAVGDIPVNAFDLVIGIAYTGVFFAAAVAGGRQVGILRLDGQISGPDVRGKKVLIADDVIFKGKRAKEAIAKVEAAGGNVVGLACIVDRSHDLSLSKNVPIYSAAQCGSDDD